jgi:tRNA pseudouridine38-40 synthase
VTRRVLGARWHTRGNDVLRFDITATAHRQQVVRSIIGALVGMGFDKKRAGEVTTFIRGADRSSAGPHTAPPGLYLWEVYY